MGIIPKKPGTEGTTEIELLIRAANFDDPDNGGLRSIRFGSQVAIDQMDENKLGSSNQKKGHRLSMSLFCYFPALFVCLSTGTALPTPKAK